MNSPNDVVVKSDGTIWFTDPSYGILSDDEGVKAESEIGACHVYRFNPATSDVQIVADDLEKLNGLAFSPDENLLYISDHRLFASTRRAPPCKVFDVVDCRRPARSRSSAMCDSVLRTRSGSTSTATFSPPRTTASRYMRRTAAGWARSWYPRSSPTVRSAAPARADLHDSFDVVLCHRCQDAGSAATGLSLGRSLIELACA